MSKDSDATKETAKMVVSSVVSRLPDLQLVEHGVQLDHPVEMKGALSTDDVPKVVDLTSMDLVEKLSICGSPEE